MVVVVSSTICAISLFISVSITYFSYETNTSVTRETDGVIEAISVCGAIKAEKLTFNTLFKLLGNVELSDIAELDGIDAKEVDVLKFYRSDKVCFRLLRKVIPQKRVGSRLNGHFSWTLRTSPTINRTTYKSRILIILHSPYEIPGTQRQATFFSKHALVDYTRVVRLPGITCTNIKNQYEDSRESCVRKRILTQCPNLDTGPVFK